MALTLARTRHAKGDAAGKGRWDGVAPIDRGRIVGAGGDALDTPGAPRAVRPLDVAGSGCDWRLPCHLVVQVHPRVLQALDDTLLLRAGYLGQNLHVLVKRL